MRAVLISIQPKYVDLIAKGEKTIEVRKSRPKLETPFKCYIYETQGDTETPFIDEDGHIIFKGRGKVIGEFVCDRVDEYKAEFTDLHIFNAMKKDVCLNEVRRVGYYDDDGEPYYYYETSNEEENPDGCKLLKESCLTLNELRQYIGKTFYDKSFYGWHISNLKIYDKPKELREFYRECNHICIDTKKRIKCEKFKIEWGNEVFDCNYLLPITRPPQSWCYVES